VDIFPSHQLLGASTSISFSTSSPILVIFIAFVIIVIIVIIAFVLVFAISPLFSFITVSDDAEISSDCGLRVKLFPVYHGGTYISLGFEFGRSGEFVYISGSK